MVLELYTLTIQISCVKYNRNGLLKESLMNPLAFAIGFLLGLPINPGVALLWGVVAGMILFPPKERR